MTDIPSSRETWTWRVSFSVFSFLFNTVLIVWLLGWGNGTNPLHQAALHWAFVVNGGILTGLGAASILPELLARKP